MIIFLKWQRLQEAKFHIPQISDFLKNKNNKTFFLSPTDESEIISCISSFSINKSSGPYSIPIKILQLVKNEIASPLSQIINLSFFIKTEDSKSYSYFQKRLFTGL